MPRHAQEFVSAERLLQEHSATVAERELRHTQMMRVAEQAVKMALAGCATEC
jgi:hypothetical protein